MKQILSILFLSFFLLTFSACSIAGGKRDKRQSIPAFKNFVTRSGDKLMDGGKRLRFISFNIPNLHYIEDNMPFEETNPWRLPDTFEIRDALFSVKQMGGKVIRIYTISVKKPGDLPGIPRHVVGPGKFDEETFRALDKVLQQANKIGIRIIIPLVGNWNWWGGIEEYAAFRGKQSKSRGNFDRSKSLFWTDPQLISDFEKTIHYILNRTNVYTGVKYKNDKAILAWETGNELLSPQVWTSKIASYIKAIDPNHLVIDGYHTTTLKDETINDPNIDIVTTHHYEGNGEAIFKHIIGNCKKLKGKKPYIIGEFGFIPTEQVKVLLDKIIESNVSGALIWSLRFRDRDGGFYWHSEPFGSNKYKAYHWPGFASGNNYDETNLLKTMRQKAFKINGLTVPPIVKPAPPVMLPVTAASAISWKGSAGACCYELERAENVNGPWKILESNISDADVQYRPLFCDSTVNLNKTYYYRVRAKNGAGVSEPSNIAGPVKVNNLAIIDEMADYSKMYSHKGTFSIRSDNTRQAKEDMTRVEGKKDNSITYKTSGSISSLKVDVFFPENLGGIRFFASSDGITFTEFYTQQKNLFSGKGKYGYWKPVLYKSSEIPDNSKYLSLIFGAENQISRIEIYYRNY